MKIRHALFAATALSIAASAGFAAQATIPAYVSAAVADSHRPQANKDQDAVRHPAEMMAFSGVKPGDKVAEFVAGGGYVTRLFSKIVGPMGHVYVVNMPALNERFKSGVDPIIADKADYPNISKVEQPLAQLKLPEPVDVVWTSENYHDYQNPGMFQTDTNAMNKAVFAALKPGGLYVITDYEAPAGSGKKDTQTLHRIDPAVIKSEVTAAGFMLEGESNALKNPNDKLTERSHQTDSQVFLKFRKPR
jgi:predicted methyltransferase